MSESQIRSEMTKVEDALVNLIGKKPAYMRPPYLETSGAFLPTMKSMNYKVITNDVDSQDWNNKTPQQSEQTFSQAGASGNGHIPLMHETYSGTVNTLTPWLINWAKQNNLKLVTVGECRQMLRGGFRGVADNCCSRVPGRRRRHVPGRYLYSQRQEHLLEPRRTSSGGG
jgi:peptidoglycan/xylan/chitin deacetylase (PgdA/CDA1 family)